MTCDNSVFTPNACFISQIRLRLDLSLQILDLAIVNPVQPYKIHSGPKKLVDILQVVSSSIYYGPI